MKKNLQQITKSLYQQKRVVLLILCMIAYVAMICIIRADAEAKTLDVVADSAQIVVSDTMAEAPEIEVQTIERPTEVTTEEDYENKSEYYRELYGPKPDNKVTVGEYEFDYIPGAPFNVYEDIARAIEQAETVEVHSTEHYSENTETVEVVEISAPEETVITEPAIVEEPTADYTEAAYTPGELRYHGVLYWNSHKWTWYSEKVLPGGGLDIPGRYTDGDGFVCDENGYICLAADPSYIATGTVIDTPFGRLGKIYDTGCAYGTVDVYVGW